MSQGKIRSLNPSLGSLVLELRWEIYYYYYYFPFIFISWRLITLQYCGFCHTLTWISRGFTCVPHPDPPPTSLSTRSLCAFPVHQARALVTTPGWMHEMRDFCLFPSTELAIYKTQRWCLTPCRKKYFTGRKTEIYHTQ